MAGRIGIWTNVPHGSQILISVSGTTATSLVTAHARVLRNDGLQQEFPDSMLQPGPLIIGLDFPHTYSIQTDLVFGTSAHAVVTARVIDRDNVPVPPDGDPRPEYNEAFDGSAGEVIGIVFLIVTRQT